MHRMPIGCDAPGAPWVAEGQHGRHLPALLNGHAQQFVHLVREITKHHRHDAADAFSTGGEQRTPNRRVDVGAAEIVDGEDEKQQRDLVEMVSQVIPRTFHSAHRFGVSARVGTGRRRYHRSRSRPEFLVFEGAGLPEQFAELVEEFRIVNGQKVPALGVAPIRGTNGRIQDAGLRGQRNRIRPQPPHHPGGVQRFIDIHLSAPLRYSGQLLFRILSTKSTVSKVGSKCASTSAFMVPKVVCGRCFMPSLNAARMRCLNCGRGWAAVTAASASGAKCSRPTPTTSTSTPACSKATSGARNSGTPGVVCRAMPSHTVSASASSKPWAARKSRAALAPSTSKRTVEVR